MSYNFTYFFLLYINKIYFFMFTVCFYKIVSLVYKIPLVFLIF